MKAFLSLNDCFGLKNPDRLLHVNAGDINPDTGKAYAVNPSSGVWDDNYFSKNFGNQQNTQSSSNPSSTTVSVPSFQDTLNNARQLQQFQVQANQPAIQNLQGQSTDLQSRYKDLLTSIQGQGSVAVNAQTLATNNELGRRGISGDSGIAQQQMASALLPVTTQYAGLTAQTGLQEQQDINSIASQIASLQAGNPQTAITGATNFLTAQQAAQTTNAQIAAQLQTANQQADIQRQANLIQQAYNTGQLSNQQASLALQNLTLQKVTLPQSQANITSALAGAGAAGADAALKQYQLQTYQNGGNLNLSTTPSPVNYSSAVPYGPTNPSLKNAAGF